VQQPVMANVFETYTTVLQLDATYNLTNQDMPLFVFLCTEGN
jgi:hypothetical protein